MRGGDDRSEPGIPSDARDIIHDKSCKTAGERKLLAIGSGVRGVLALAIEAWLHRAPSR